MTDVAAAAPPEPVVEKPRKRRKWLERASDWLNPILVRETHQSLNGKAIVATAGLALLGILVIALYVASQDEVSPRDGAEAFITTMYVLIPILFFIVPFQAFFSMRSEVGGGTVEHLLMSRLSPGRIVRGKLLAATVQFGLYMAIFSPLLAMTYLLRGVDVPTIAVVLTLSFIVALACSSLAIACGALCRWRAFFRVIPFAIVLLGLGYVTGGAIEILEEVTRELRRAFAEEEFFYYFASMSMVPLAATVLFSMVGAAALSHPYENRSTGFRLFALGFVLLVFGWTIYNHQRMTASGMGRFIDLTRQLQVGGIMCGAILCLFPFFASTESLPLSPRVRRHVPRNPIFAVLVSPLLPGAGRGLLFTILLGGLVLAGVAFLPGLWGVNTPGRPQTWDTLYAVWLYIVFFSAVGCLVRRCLADAESRNWWARAALPILLMVSVIVPLLISVVAGGGVMRRWNPLHILNPFFTIDRLWRDDEILVWLGAVTGVLVTINLPAILRGVLDVLRASKNRRARAS